METNGLAKEIRNLPNSSDYIAAVSVEHNILVPALKGGYVLQDKGQIVNYTGAFCIVFPYIVDNKKYAIRCWRCLDTDLKERITRKAEIISEELSKLNLPYFLKYAYHENGINTSKGRQPLVVMDWTDNGKLKDYIANHINEPDTLRRLSESFMQMVKKLHDNNISHGDLQPNNILVNKNGQLLLIDYDTLYLPKLEGERDNIGGLPEFQHKARFSNRLLTPKADYFSELVIYISLRSLSKFPSLWHELKLADSKHLMFSVEDLNSEGTSDIFKRLRNDPELKSLTDILISFLKKGSIEELLPLEESTIIPPNEQHKRLPLLSCPVFAGLHRNMP